VIVRNVNYLSKSGFQLYNKCPLKYRMKYLDKLVEPESVYKPTNDFGNLIHGNIQNVKKNIKLVKGKLVFKKPYTHKETVIIKEKEYVFDERLHMNNFLKFSNELYAKFGKKKYALPKITEGHYYNHKLRIHGFIDAVYELPGGGVAIVDWKTGSKKTKAKMREETMFYALCWNARHKQKVKFIQMYFTKFDHHFKEEVSSELLAKLVKKIKLSHLLLKKNLFNKAVHRGVCWYCSWKYKECDLFNLRGELLKGGDK